MPISRWKAQELDQATTILCGLDPRVRLLAALSFAALAISTSSLIILTGLLITAFCLGLIQGLPFGYLIKRLLALEAFMAVLLISLPFNVPGDILFSLGPLNASFAGTEQALKIALRAASVALCLIALIGTLKSVVLGHALSRLGVPSKLVHLFLFTVRYIAVLFEEYSRLHQAMRARAFRPALTRHSLNALGWLIGMLLVKSLERSERITAAMKCRGFSGKFFLFDDTKIAPNDIIFLALWMVALLSAVIYERVLL